MAFKTACSRGLWTMYKVCDWEASERDEEDMVSVCGKRNVLECQGMYCKTLKNVEGVKLINYRPMWFSVRLIS